MKMRWSSFAALALGLVATTTAQDTQDCPLDFLSFEVVTGMQLHSYTGHMSKHNTQAMSTLPLPICLTASQAP